MKLADRVNMFILVLLFVTSAHGDWVWSDDCNNDPIDDGEREAVVRYDKNLTSLMDPGEGCRWIFKSGSTECCYSDDTDQCEYETHDKEKCRKNHTEFIVHPTYPTRKCVLQLFNIGYKDAGEFTQTTRTFNFTIKLTVTRNKDWEIPTISVFSTIGGATVIAAISIALWKLRKLWKTKKDEKSNAIWGLLKDENEESFQLQSKKVDVWKAKDKDGNNLLHLIGMLYWTKKKTDMIYNYCQKKKLCEHHLDGEQRRLESTDRISEVLSLPFMKTIVNAKNNIEETPLHIAAKFGKSKLVESLLLIEGVDINASDEEHWTPLHHAAYKGHTEVIHILLARSEIKVEANDRTPLLLTGHGGKLEAFKVLVRHGAKLNATTEDGQNILHIVSQKGNANENKGRIHILKAILKETEQENFQEKQQRLKPLFQALYLEDTQETVNSMANKKASCFGTPLEIAVSSGFIQAAELLIENGADFRTKLDQENQQQKLHLLLPAVLKGEKAFADFLLRQDPNLVNTKTDKNESYLHVAIANLNLNAVILFLNMKIDKDATNSEGKTALEFAQAKLKNSPNENKLPKIISELNKERTDINKKDILENIKKSGDNMKHIEQKLKGIEIKNKNESEVFIEQLKKATRDEKGWKKALKDLEGESDLEEKDQEDKKRENPTMEKIRSRVTDMIDSNTKITISQMAQVLKLLNDEGISRANTGISRANSGSSRPNTGISQVNTENGFLMPNSNVNRVSFQSD